MNGPKEPTWLLLDLVVAVHQMLLAEHGGAGGLRDKALLESALARPRHQFEYGDGPSIFSLTASYCYGLARNHPFVDGNKRIALTAAAVFLEINGYAFNAPEAEAVVMIRQLAAGQLSEKELSGWFGDRSLPKA